MAAALGTDPTAAILDAVATLSEQSDEAGLARALLAMVAPLCDATAVRLLALSSESGDREFDSASADSALARDTAVDEEPWPLQNDPCLADCVRTRSPLDSREADGSRRLVVPVIGVRHVMQLLVIDGLRELGLASASLDALARIYGNQLLHVMRNERDPLTGLYNRQSFGERLRHAVSGAAPHRRSLGLPISGSSFALIDIDHFKQVNDTYGHVYGDEVLILLARLMTRSFRHEDMLFRYGGEEFAIVLAAADLTLAARILERFRADTEAYEFPRIGRKTISIGLTLIAPDDAVPDIVARADQALYYAKAHGRNRVHAYEDLVARGAITPPRISAGDIELF